MTKNVQKVEQNLNALLESNFYRGFVHAKQIQNLLNLNSVFLLSSVNVINLSSGGLYIYTYMQLKRSIAFTCLRNALTGHKIAF